jgi:hypothetical protein
MNPENKNVLGQSNKQCTDGEKKLLLLSHADQMADEQVLTTFVTDYDASYRMAENDLLDAAYEPRSFFPSATVYGQTRRLKNDDDLRQPVDRNDPFPNAVEMCVPTATTDLTMWMHVYSSLGLSNETSVSFEYFEYSAQERRRQLLQGPEGGDPPTTGKPTMAASRQLTPSFAIMDEEGCLAVPDDSCVLTTSGAPHFFSACPTGGDLPVATKMTLRTSDSAKCAGYWDMNDHIAMNSFPEIAMMEAVEAGFNVTQFSTYITDPPSDGASCPDGSEEMYFIVSSPVAGMDTFSYGVKSVTDHGKVTKVRNSGGTLISPKRTMVSGPQTYTAKFPVRFNGELAFDCFEVSGSSTTGSTAPATFATSNNFGIIYYEIAYKELYNTALRDAQFIPQSAMASCTYAYVEPSFRASRLCAAAGEYTIQGTKAQSSVSSAGSKVIVTDANG